jgi:hypothetical protein
MNSLADQTAFSECDRPFCAAHLPTVDGTDVVHISPERAVELGEGARALVSVEQAPDEPVAVRLEVTYDATMTPAQALQLAHVLTVSAFAAVSGGAR